MARTNSTITAEKKAFSENDSHVHSLPAVFRAALAPMVLTFVVLSLYRTTGEDWHLSA
jgi:hypothetical protein